MLFYFIFLALVFWMFIDYKKALIAFFAIKGVFNRDICLINMPGLPMLQLETALALLFLVMSYLRISTMHFNLDQRHYPFSRINAVAMISIFSSTVLSEVGFLQAFSRALQEAAVSFLLIKVLWDSIENGDDVRQFVRLYFVVFVVFGIYGIFERMNGFVNPVMMYEDSLILDRIESISYDADSRAGLGRIRSLMIHAIGFGGYMALGIGFFMQLLDSGFFHKAKERMLVISAIVVAAVCIVFTNSRSPIMLLLPLLASFINSLKRFAMVSSLIVGGLLFVAQTSYADNYLSFFDTSAADRVGGSDKSMRIAQFSTAFGIMLEKPIFGHGIKTQMDYQKKYEDTLLGCESVWIEMMIERGLVGCAVYAVVIYGMIKMLTGRFARFSLFASLGWLVFSSSTTAPGINFSNLLVLLVVLRRLSLIENLTGRCHGASQAI